jgi:hypothetical protein
MLKMPLKMLNILVQREKWTSPFKIFSFVRFEKKKFMSINHFTNFMVETLMVYLSLNNITLSQLKSQNMREAVL